MDSLFVNNSSNKSSYYLINLLFSPPNTTLDSKPSIVNSGTTRHFFPNLVQGIPTETLSITLPKGDSTYSNSYFHINLPLSPSATKTHIIHDLHHHLLSVGQLCDNDCAAIFLKDTMYLYKLTDYTKNIINSILYNEKSILDTKRDLSLGLYLHNTNILLHSDKSVLNTRVVHPKTPAIKCNTPSKKHSNLSSSINSVCNLCSQRDIVQFHQSSAGSLCKSTFLKAICNGNFKTWPGLDSKVVSKHLLKEPATIKGHLCQTRKIYVLREHILF